MTTHSSVLAWRIPWTEEPGRLQSMGLRRVGHDWATSLHFDFSLSCTGEGNGNPLQCSCLENPRDGGAWWAVVYGVAESRTRLKRLSSSSSRLARWTQSLGGHKHLSYLPYLLQSSQCSLRKLRLRNDSFLPHNPPWGCGRDASPTRTQDWLQSQSA